MTDANRFGSDFDAAAKAGFEGGNVIHQKSFDFDVPYKFRVMLPLMPKHRILYPCLVPDDKNPGELRSSWRELRSPMNYDEFGWKKVPTVIDTLKEIDLSIRLKHKSVGTTEKIQSFFDVQKTWIIPVLDRRDTEIKVKYLEVSWQIFNELREMHKELDEDDQTKLANCPVWCHDVILSKVRKKPDSNLPDKHNTAYKAKMAKNNQWAGKIGASVIKDPSQQQELFEVSVDMEIFTEEEYNAVSAITSNDMLSQFGPHTSAEIIEILTNAPIDFNAKNKDGGSIFPAPQEIGVALLQHSDQFGGFLPATSEALASAEGGFSGEDGEADTSFDPPAEEASPAAELNPKNEVKQPAETAKETTDKTETKTAITGKSTKKKKKLPPFVSSLNTEA